MKALVYVGANRLEMRDLPEPVPRPDQAVVDVALCGICGSDMHAYHGADERRVPPLVLGHEPVGHVREGALAGRRVAINPLMTCGACAACQAGRPHLCDKRALIGLFDHGAFAEAVAVDAKNLTALPDALGFEHAVLAEPLAVAVHAVRLGLARLPGAPAELSVAILGGGAIGLLLAAYCASLGIAAPWLAEPNALRRRLVAETVAARVYDPAEGGPGPGSVDLVLDAVGSGRTREAACALARPGGTVVHVGLQDIAPGLDTRRLTLWEIALLGTYCYTPDDFAEALRLLAEGAVRATGWTETRPLEAGIAAFADIDAGRAPPKIVLAP